MSLSVSYPQNYLSRNFYTLRFLALFLAFAINFILLFYKVLPVWGQEEDALPILWAGGGEAWPRVCSLMDSLPPIPGRGKVLASGGFRLDTWGLRPLWGEGVCRSPWHRCPSVHRSQHGNRPPLVSPVNLGAEPPSCHTHPSS